MTPKRKALGQVLKLKFIRTVKMIRRFWWKKSEIRNFPSNPGVEAKIKSKLQWIQELANMKSIFNADLVGEHSAKFTKHISLKDLMKSLHARSSVKTDSRKRVLFLFISEVYDENSGKSLLQRL